MLKGASDGFWKANPGLVPQLAGREDSKPEHHKQEGMGVPPPAPAQLARLDGPLLVRIGRVSRRPLDDDNMSGGCKELRDAIAEALGRKGDSEGDGIRFEYWQGQGPDETRIEIFQEGK